MAELATIATAVITGLVGAFKAYTEYKAAVTKAEEKQGPQSAKTPEVATGEQAASIIKAGVAEYGDEDEKLDLASFERNPARYQNVLAKVLIDIAAREPAFGSQLQTLAQQANIQTGGLQGHVNVSDEGKIIGTAVGVNAGTITGTYTVRPDDQ